MKFISLDRYEVWLWERPTSKWFHLDPNKLDNNWIKILGIKHPFIEGFLPFLGII